MRTFLLNSTFSFSVDDLFGSAKKKLYRCLLKKTVLKENKNIMKATWDFF